MRQKPNLLKKLTKCDVAWKSRKRVMGCLIDTLRLTIYLPTSQLQKLQAALVEILPTQCRTLCRKWACLVGIIHSILPALPGGGGLFSHIQVVLSDSQGRLHLSIAVHKKLRFWGCLLEAFDLRPTHLQEALYLLNWTYP